MCASSEGAYEHERAYDQERAYGSAYEAATGHGYGEERGYGWVAFAGVLLLCLGTLNIIGGIAAIGNAHFFRSATRTSSSVMLTTSWEI
jgi:hypothetical protein